MGQEVGGERGRPQAEVDMIPPHERKVGVQGKPMDLAITSACFPEGYHSRTACVPFINFRRMELSLYP